MFEWSDTDLIMRDTVREFIDKEIRPHLDVLETGELSPYPIARKLFSEFGLDVVAAEAVKTMLDKERAKQDTETEKQIQEAIGRLIEGRTTFAIAHRLSTLRNATRLMVMERGKMVERGASHTFGVG